MTDVQEAGREHFIEPAGRDIIRLAFGTNLYDTPAIKRMITIAINKLYEEYAEPDADGGSQIDTAEAVLSWIYSFPAEKPLPQLLTLSREGDRYTLESVDVITDTPHDAGAQELIASVKEMVETQFFQALIPQIEKVEAARERANISREAFLIRPSPPLPDDLETWEPVEAYARRFVKMAFGSDPDDTQTIKSTIVQYSDQLCEKHFAPDNYDPDGSLFETVVLNALSWIYPDVGHTAPVTEIIALIMGGRYLFLGAGITRKTELTEEQRQEVEERLRDLNELIETEFFKDLVPMINEVERLRQAEERQQSTFAMIRQGQATNMLTKITTANTNNTRIDPVTGEATIKRGGYTVTIPNFATIAGLRTTTHQLFDALIIKLTDTGAKSPVIMLPLLEYAKMRGLSTKSMKDTRERVEEDLETLFNARISFKERRRGKKTGQDFHDVRIIEAKGIENGVIIVTLGNILYSNIIAASNPMSYPLSLLRLNSKRSPASFALGRKIAEHKNMNAGRMNEDIISVKTLLAAAEDFIPSYESVVKSNSRHVGDKIIERLGNGLDALSDTFTWEYCHSKGAPLTDEEIANLDYSLFITLNVRIYWRSYPDQTARLERRQQRIDRAKAKRKPRKKQDDSDTGAGTGGGDGEPAAAPEE